MQKNIIPKLKKRGIEVQAVNIKENIDKMIYQIYDSEKLIFLIELENYEDYILENYVNILMDWIVYEQQSIEEDFVDDYHPKYTMRQILWDIYVIFVFKTELGNNIPIEDIYRVQRDNRHMKRYIVQGKSDNEIVEKISFIVRPEKKIDEFINKMDFQNNEIEHCKKMSHTGNGDNFELGFEGSTYDDILNLLEQINSETYGEK